jgi:hypothetical protein
MGRYIVRQRFVKHESVHENEGVIEGYISFSDHLEVCMEVVTDSSSLNVAELAVLRDSKIKLSCSND